MGEWILADASESGIGDWLLGRRRVPASGGDLLLLNNAFFDTKDSPTSGTRRLFGNEAGPPSKVGDPLAGTVLLTIFGFRSELLESLDRTVLLTIFGLSSELLESLDKDRWYRLGCSGGEERFSSEKELDRPTPDRSAATQLYASLLSAADKSFGLSPLSPCTG